MSSGILQALNLDTSENLFSWKLPDSDSYRGWDCLGWQGDTIVFQDGTSGRMLLDLSLSNTSVANDEAEIFYIYAYGGEVHAGYYKPYTLDELIRRGHELIGEP